MIIGAMVLGAEHVTACTAESHEDGIADGAGTLPLRRLRLLIRTISFLWLLHDETRGAGAWGGDGRCRWFTSRFGPGLIPRTFLKDTPSKSPLTRGAGHFCVIVDQGRSHVLVERVPRHERDITRDDLADYVSLAPGLYFRGNFACEGGIEREDTRGVERSVEASRHFGIELRFALVGQDSVEELLDAPDRYDVG